VFIWLAFHAVPLGTLVLYFQSLKRKTSLAPALRKSTMSLDEPILFIGDEKRGEIDMFTDAINRVPSSHEATRRYHFLSSLLALAFAFAIYPTQAHAQIIGGLEANIPFPFYAGNTKLPAGEYRIQVLDNSDLTLMEISRVDGAVSALFQIQDAENNSEPAKSELIFNKYGDRYFLAKFFDEDNRNGSQVTESRYEKKVSQATLESQEHVPAHHQTRRGK